MHNIPSLILLFSCTSVAAQPGLRGLDVVFALYHNHEMVPPSEVQRGTTVVVSLGSQITEVAQWGYTDFNVVTFDPYRSDPERHVDTLWMTIGWRDGQMRVGFPPRTGPHAELYSTNMLRIDLRPDSVMVTDLPRQIQVKGFVRNGPEISKSIKFFALNVRSSDHWAPDGVYDPITGRIDATLLCEPVRGKSGEEVRLTLQAQSWIGQMNTEMHIRHPFAPILDLDTFDLVPTHFRSERGRLVIDTSVPRDSIIAGNEFGTEVLLFPVNPAPSDTFHVELRWMGSGAPYVSSHTLVERTDGITEVRFAFALRTDVDVATDSWMQQAQPIRIPCALRPDVTVAIIPGNGRTQPFPSYRLPQGRYVLTQEMITGKDIRTVDFLIGREVPFTVGTR